MINISSLTASLALVLPTLVQSPAPTYWQDIRPVFRKHCTVCHSAKNLAELDVSGGLALDTFTAALKGSRQPVVRPGESTNSLLIKLITTDNAKKRMPLDAPALPKETIELIRRWIDAGAKEGKETDATPEAPTTVKNSVTRKLDILFATSAAPPAGLLGKLPPAKLDLALKIGPLAPVAAVAFSPDNKLLAAGSYGQAAIWDLTTGKPAKVLHNVLGAVNDLRFSPDGKILAVAGGQPSAKGDLRLYQTSDWKLLGVLRGHDDVVFSVSFSPDGKKLASASFDHTLSLWDVEQLKRIQSYKAHSDFIYAVAFSASATHVFSASKDRTVQMIDLATGKSTFTFSGMEQDVMAVAVSPDGKNVVSSGFEPGIYWWNPQSGERMKVQNGHGVAVHDLAFSKDGKKLVSAGADRTVRIWDGQTGAAGKTISVGSIAYAAAISANNKLIAAGCFDGVTRLYDEPSGRSLASLVAVQGDGDHPAWLAVTPEGYAAGSDQLLALARVRMGGQEVSAAPVWPALRRPDMVAKALRGESVEGVKFEKR